ncbi:hypothetical protein A464_484 [Salmonella bongori N268-08]|uniref:Uncharacterized protein n=1 Tax=Salmonella bongori N268-08 TaxID=1197719 RepID=S5N5C5_SALBN|nr:hypothetical protein A464_484 [Salmonella bongori N268-08]
MDLIKGITGIGVVFKGNIDCQWIMAGRADKQSPELSVTVVPGDPVISIFMFFP